MFLFLNSFLSPSFFLSLDKLKIWKHSSDNKNIKDSWMILHGCLTRSVSACVFWSPFGHFCVHDCFISCMVCFLRVSMCHQFSFSQCFSPVQLLLLSLVMSTLTCSLSPYIHLFVFSFTSTPKTPLHQSRDQWSILHACPCFSHPACEFLPFVIISFAICSVTSSAFPFLFFFSSLFVFC